MGFLQEGAIFIGDNLTQPILAKRLSKRLGCPIYIDKVVSKTSNVWGDKTKHVDWYLRTYSANKDCKKIG